MAEWPDACTLMDHWSWRPEWTPNRPRLLWYLTFQDSPEVAAAAAPARGHLKDAGADVIPSPWLHLTVTDMGFPDEVDSWTRRVVTAEIRRALRDLPAFDLSLGPVAVLPEAVVLAAEPREPLRLLRQGIREAMTLAGVHPPDDVESEWPHVSLCYVNCGTDHDRLRQAAREIHCPPVQVRCDRVEQVLVTRDEGHYRWEVLDEVRLHGYAAEEALRWGTR